MRVIGMRYRQEMRHIKNTKQLRERDKLIQSKKGEVSKKLKDEEMISKGL